MWIIGLLLGLAIGGAINGVEGALLGALIGWALGFGFGQLIKRHDAGVEEARMGSRIERVEAALKAIEARLAILEEGLTSNRAGQSTPAGTRGSGRAGNTESPTAPSAAGHRSAECAALAARP